MENLHKKTMTTAERLKVAGKLDEDLKDFFSGLEKLLCTEGWPEDRWQEEMEKFFMKQLPEPRQRLHPFMEGLQQLYDFNNLDELANAYKEDGNFNFLHKNYRLAIIAYTEAIKVKCGNPNIEAILYNKRAAANYFLNNYNSALRDSELALKLKPDYDKAVIQAANCCNEIKQYEKAIEFCDSLLKKNPKDKEIIQLRHKCNKNRKREISKKKEILTKAILSRKIKIEGGLKLKYLESVPELANHRVFLTETGVLSWPVMFLYPEYCQMAFLRGVQEEWIFGDYMEQVLEKHPVWDVDKKYIPKNVNVYFENYKKYKAYKIELDMTLLEILQQKEFIVEGGTPTFIVLVKDSPAEKKFLEQYR